MAVLEKIKVKKTLSEQIYDALKNAIIDLDLKPGEIVTEESLADMLGVSRTPLKTAINKLIYEGLMVIVPGKGTIISELSIKQLEDGFKIRESLETLSIELAVENYLKEDLEELKEISKRQSQINTNELSSSKEFFTIDRDFHFLIAKMGKNEYLPDLIEPIILNCSRFLHMNVSKEILDEALSEHDKIIEAIEKGNKEKAKELMLKHVRNSKNRLVKD